MTEATDSRRDFLSKIGFGSAVVLLKTTAGDVKAISDPTKIQTIVAPSGQAVDEIIIGTFGQPTDANFVVEFYRTESPNVTQLQVPLNARATFRWVAAPDREIRLLPNERLLWRIAYANGDPGTYRVVIHTRGQCLLTKRVVINQSEFA